MSIQEDVVFGRIGHPFRISSTRNSGSHRDENRLQARLNCNARPQGFHD
jgi:hypothetical protein